MSKFAIIKLGARQFLVEEGKQYRVPKFNVDEGKIEIKEVLAVGDGKEVKLGSPFVDTAVVNLDVFGNVKGEKIKTEVYKAKSRYRRTKGFRKQLTHFEVKKISF